MITRREDYKIVDVSIVPSITGDIMPVRDGTARARIPKMEDCAFLLEAFAERGLAYYSLPALTFPPKGADFWFYCIGWHGSVRAEDVADGVDDVVYGTHRFGYAYGDRECYPLQDDANLSSFGATSYDGGTIFVWLRDNYPAALWWSSALPVHYQDFIQRPVAASGDLVRRMYYLLRSMRRWLFVPDSTAEDWRNFLITGTAYYSYGDDDGEGTSRQGSGNTAFSAKNQSQTVTVYGSGDYSSSATVTTMLYYEAQTSGRNQDLGFAESYKSVLASVAKFKTKVKFSSLAVFLQFQVEATGYCRRSGATANTDGYSLVRRFTCTLVSNLSNDPDGYVQEWELDLPGTTPMELRAWALSQGFHTPGTTAGTFGRLTVAAMTGLCLDGVPIWRTEIDSTGWN